MLIDNSQTPPGDWPSFAIPSHQIHCPEPATPHRSTTKSNELTSAEIKMFDNCIFRVNFSFFYFGWRSRTHHYRHRLSAASNSLHSVGADDTPSEKFASLFVFVK